MKLAVATQLYFLKKKSIERSEKAASLSTSKKESGGVDIKCYNVL